MDEVRIDYINFLLNKVQNASREDDYKTMEQITDTLLTQIKIWGKDNDSDKI